MPVSFVVDWLLGETPLPTDIFLRAVDIVLQANVKQVVANKDFLERVRERYRRK